MAIRLRIVDGTLVALCAARSIEKPGDVYLDDGQHAALGDKFARDYNEMFNVGLPTYKADLSLVEREENNNPNRDDWNTTFGNPEWEGNQPISE